MNAVTSTGTASTAPAEEVDRSIATAAPSLMGVTVPTDADTWFHGAELADLQTGMPVAISGSWDQDGSVLALGNGNKHVGQQVEIRGWVYNRRSKGKLHKQELHR